jgi:phospholipase/carboxylesterase
MRRILLLVLLLSHALHGQKINTPLVYKVQEAGLSSPQKPVLILLHGYGSNEDDLLGITPSIDKRFAIFSLRGPIPVGTNGYCWNKLEFLPGHKRRYDYREVISSRKLILDFITQVCTVYKTNPSNIYLLGFSQGAIMSFDIALNAPHAIAGAVALSGRVVPESYRDRKVDRSAGNLKFFIGHGTSDSLILFTEAEETVSALKSQGVGNITFKHYNISHTISKQEIAELNKWLTDMLSVRTVPAAH